MDFNAFSTENNDFFALEMLVRKIVEILNLIVSNSAIKAMLFYECRLTVLMNHSETIVIKAT